MLTPLVFKVCLAIFQHYALMVNDRCSQHIEISILLNKEIISRKIWLKPLTFFCNHLGEIKT